MTPEEIIAKSRENTNVITESTYDNINLFIENNKDIDKLIELSLYIGGICVKRPPNEFEKLFIEEFFTTSAWVEYVNDLGKPKGLFIKIPPFDLDIIRGILSFEVMILIQERQKSIQRKLNRLIVEKASKKLLKIELDIAISNSQVDGIFDKIEGCCNVYEVLIKNKLVKEYED